LLVGLAGRPLSAPLLCRRSRRRRRHSSSSSSRRPVAAPAPADEWAAVAPDELSSLRCKQLNGIPAEPPGWPPRRLINENVTINYGLAGRSRSGGRV